jgi:hypothetical protein
MSNPVSSTTSTAPSSVLSIASTVNTAASSGIGSSSTAGTPASSLLSNSSAKVYDKRDLNKDGKVTEIERMRYDVTHPPEKKKPVEKKNPIQSVQTYNQYAKSVIKPTGGTLDAFK